MPGRCGRVVDIEFDQKAVLQQGQVVRAVDLRDDDTLRAQLVERANVIEVKLTRMKVVG
jgi:hypothetical protein